MASKPTRTLVDIIRADVGEASLAAMEAVSDSDTGREKITYVPRTSLLPDNRNFYSLDGIEELAANIEMVGLLDPLRVRGMEGEPTLYRIVSGHRRRAALDKLAIAGNKNYEMVPVIIERGNVSPAMQELRLIYANMDTRRMSSADTSKQAERVEMLLYDLQKEGVEFPGRMRAHVAEACKVSETKIATLKKIREHLIDEWKARWEVDTLSESAAYTLAQMPEERQAILYDWYGDRERWQLGESALKEYGATLDAIDALECPGSFGGGACSNRKNMLNSAKVLDEYSPPCRSCCAECPGYRIKDCYFACPKLAEKVAQLKADAQAAREAVAERRKRNEATWAAEMAAEKAAKINILEKLWQRARELRAESGMDAISFYAAAQCPEYFVATDILAGYDSGTQEIDADAPSPFGASLKPLAAKVLVDFADKLGVSLDYLLCRTDDPTPPGAVSESDTDTLQWHTGTPDRDGRYWTLAEDGRSVEDLYWYDSAWHLYKADVDDGLTDFEVIKWYPLPDV